MKNKIVVVGIIIFAILLAVAAAMSWKPATGTDRVIDIKSPPEILPVQESAPQVPESVNTIDLSANDEIVCDHPSKDSKYGGISGSENKPPKGTEISKELTEKNGRPMATGVCGTYQYIVGWWFTESEIYKLPYETLIYGISPYAIGGGGSGKSTSASSPVDTPPTQTPPVPPPAQTPPVPPPVVPPIVPIPEIPGALLAMFGVLGLLIWRKANSK
jgi:hypothetical protein